MGKIIRDLVEYYGISDCLSSIETFNQINIDYIFNIPIQKPDLEQILKVWVDPCIVSKKIVKTPKGISLEGQKVTGKKLLVCGDMSIKIEYVACNATQGVHSAHTKFPFCAYVVLPESFNENAIVNVSVAVEDVDSHQMDLRSIYNNITMMVIADIC